MWVKIVILTGIARHNTNYGQNSIKTLFGGQELQNGGVVLVGGRSGGG